MSLYRKTILDALKTGRPVAGLELGATGEVLLVGADNRVRSDVRAHLEDPGAYLAGAAGAGTLEPEQLARVERSATTALVAPVDGEAVRRGADGIGRTTTSDHLGRTCASSTDRSVRLGQQAHRTRPRCSTRAGSWSPRSPSTRRSARSTTTAGRCCSWPRSWSC